MSNCFTFVDHSVYLAAPKSSPSVSLCWKVPLSAEVNRSLKERLGEKYWSNCFISDFLPLSKNYTVFSRLCQKIFVTSHAFFLSLLSHLNEHLMWFLDPTDQKKKKKLPTLLSEKKNSMDGIIHFTDLHHYSTDSFLNLKVPPCLFSHHLCVFFLLEI